MTTSVITRSSVAVAAISMPPRPSTRASSFWMEDPHDSAPGRYSRPNPCEPGPGPASRSFGTLNIACPAGW